MSGVEAIMDLARQLAGIEELLVALSRKF